MNDLIGKHYDHRVSIVFRMKMVDFAALAIAQGLLLRWFLIFSSAMVEVIVLQLSEPRGFPDLVLRMELDPSPLQDKAPAS